MICDFGDVVVVPFRRPSLVLSDATFNEAHGHSICAMITTAARSKWRSDVAIEDLKPAGLNRPCVVRCKLFTLPNDLILKRAGTLASQDRGKVVAAVRTILA